MECMETSKKDKEEEDNKCAEVKTKVPNTVSGAENKSGEVSCNENTKKPLSVPLCDGDDARAQDSKQKGQAPENEMEYKIIKTHKNITEETHVETKDPPKKQTGQAKEKSAVPPMSASDTSSKAITQIERPQSTTAGEINFSRKQLTSEDNIKPVFGSREAIETTEAKLHDIKKETMEECSDVMKIFKTEDDMNNKSDQISPKNTSCKGNICSQIQDGHESDSQPGQASLEKAKGESGETAKSIEKVLQIREQPQIPIPKQMESDAKKKQSRIASGAIAKRRSSEAAAFKYAQLSQAMHKSPTCTSKARETKGRTLLSPGKAVNTNTGIKGSRSAEELQRGEVLQYPGARRMSRDSTPEAKKYSTDKDCPFKVTVGPRRKSETPIRSKSGGKIKKVETEFTIKCKSSSNDKEDQDHTNKDANNGMPDTADEIKQKPMKQAVVAYPATEKNILTIEEAKIPGIEEKQMLEKKEDNIPDKKGGEMSGKGAYITSKNENHSDTKTIKTQQNIRVVNADIASTNKILSSDMGVTETKLPKVHIPQDQQRGEAKMSHVVIDEDLKKSEESFAQKKVDEMLYNQQKDISCQEDSNDKTCSEEIKTKLPVEPSPLGNQHLLTEPRVKDELLKDSNDSKYNAKLFKKSTEQSSELKHSSKMETTKYTKEDMPTSSKVETNLIYICGKDNKTSSPSIQTHKTDKKTTNKLSGMTEEMKQETTNSNLMKETHSKSSSQYDKGIKTELSTQGSSMENGNLNRSVLKSYDTKLTPEVSKFKRNKTTSQDAGNINVSTIDVGGNHARKENTSKRVQPKQNDADPSCKPMNSHAVSNSGGFNTQIPTTTQLQHKPVEVLPVQIQEKSLLHTHEELDQFISNQIQAELISKWVMNGEDSSPSSPRDFSPQLISDSVENMVTNVTSGPGNVAHKMFQGQLANPKVVQDQLQRNCAEQGTPSSITKRHHESMGMAMDTEVNKVPDAKPGKSKVVVGVHSLATRAGGHSRLAPIQDEEETKEYTLDSEARVQLDGLEEDAGRGCGGMKGTSCRLYFGVKNYLNQFYDPNSVDSVQGQGYYYTEDEDLEYLVDPEKEGPRRQRCCRGFWFRAGVWAGVNLLLVGMIALLVGYLTPPRDMVVGYHDNLEILDRWAIAFNHRLELCRLAGLAVFCCGGVLLLVTLLLASVRPRPTRTLWRDVIAEPYTGTIPSTEQIKSVQPSPWPDLLAASMP
ncbi:hypothetical protein PR048_020872 [Dryococelus australis]|uniref:Uncharacterized protein n=1 Tax=Dryococelus australis TaxID=614101 RepID=A0ABQ9GWM1_9NEOP|nr:hypothetical protein PR048_020872 [Dryococelus australis]